MNGEPIPIPVAFLDESPLRRLTVDEEGLHKLLGYDDGRSLSAAKMSSWRFRRLHNIRTEPGGKYSYEAIRKALSPATSGKRL